jgi:hypothetical protein
MLGISIRQGLIRSADLKISPQHAYQVLLENSEQIGWSNLISGIQQAVGVRYLGANRLLDSRFFLLDQSFFLFMGVFFNLSFPFQGSGMIGLLFHID